MKEMLRIKESLLDQVNSFLTKKENPVVDKLVEIVEKHGGVKKINEAAARNGGLESLMDRLTKKNPEHAESLGWLIEQKERKRFIGIDEYRKIHAAGGSSAGLDASYGVTLEISALQYFPWLVVEAKRAVERGELMPGRFIRVRFMKEQEADGDLLAVASAMKVMGSSWVEALDTKGTDGSNVHLGGPDTIAGYFGGVGQPNDYPYRWIDEYLYYYTNYGVKQVLNINGGTILAGYLLYKLGVDMEFKISVFMGTDNPLNVLWTLMTAKLFARNDGTTPLIGFNLSNSVNNWTIEIAADIRKSLDFEDAVRLEHHITETYRSIVRQPYDRLEELVEVAKKVKNISAKHEGGVPDAERARPHPSDILDYFLPKAEAERRNLMPLMEGNYLDKHDAVQRTAKALLKAGVPVLAAPELHHR